LEYSIAHIEICCPQIVCKRCTEYPCQRRAKSASDQTDVGTTPADAQRHQFRAQPFGVAAPAAAARKTNGGPDDTFQTMNAGAWTMIQSVELDYGLDIWLSMIFLETEAHFSDHALK
jgi:hypothetical protein